jgi:uncharacterized protein (UPF0276 family)
MPTSTAWPRLGAGLGLRPAHHADVLAGGHPVMWFECITENLLGAGGNPRRVARAARERWPLVLHGVSLDIGGPDLLDEAFLTQLRALADELEPAWVSDHLCWGALGGHRAHDLWPVPRTEASLAHIAARVHRVQERLGRPLVLENISAYARFAGDTLSEGAFFAELVARTGCGLLIDVNNLVVNRHNLGEDPLELLRAVPPDAVAQLHLAGHEVHPTHRIDTHDQPVDDETWALLDVALERFGPVSTCVERDDHLPPLAGLLPEVEQIAAALSARGAA